MRQQEQELMVALNPTLPQKPTCLIRGRHPVNLCFALQQAIQRSPSPSVQPTGKKLITHNTVDTRTPTEPCIPDTLGIMAHVTQLRVCLKMQLPQNSISWQLPPVLQDPVRGGLGLRVLVRFETPHDLIRNQPFKSFPTHFM